MKQKFNQVDGEDIQNPEQILEDFKMWITDSPQSFHRVLAEMFKYYIISEHTDSAEDAFTAWLIYRGLNNLSLSLQNSK